MAISPTTRTGTRIRERRLEMGLKQADLARRVNVSPSYLNLIEHNRRRIGGKLLNEIATELTVEPDTLGEGAEATLVQALQGAAAAAGQAAIPELGRTQDFAVRLPGWAGLVTAQARRIAELERTVAALSDRLAHDPHLAASLHEMLSTVTAIRSSAAILVETPDLEPHWRARFQRNVFEESERLVDGSRRLAAHLDPARGGRHDLRSPQEEVEAFLLAADHRFPALEQEGVATPESIVAASGDLQSQPAREMALRHLTRYRIDARALPATALREGLRAHGPDPVALATKLGVGAALVMRRLAALPAQPGSPEVALAVCDGSGALTYAKSAEGFAMPRLGSACPLWPLYQALSRPMVPVRAALETPGTPPGRFLAWAVSDLRHPRGLDGPVVHEATMLVLPRTDDAGAAQPVGLACPVCPRADCPARREPSLLAGGL